MQFAELLARASEINFSAVCFDTRNVIEGCVFVAVRGGHFDGHQYLPLAIAGGAKALVVEDAAAVPKSYGGPIAVVRDSRVALNQLANRFFNEPAKHLYAVGITGTNGKTTTSSIVETILNHRGWPTGVIGTIDHHLDVRGTKRSWKTEMTTPDPVSFQKRLAEFLGLGAKALAMEVSSHALHQARVDEVPFDVAIFTNLTRDHLDYHRDMEDYFDAKKKLFTELLGHSSKVNKFAIINGDDEYGRRIAGEMRATNVTTWSYGRSDAADLYLTPIEAGFGGTRFHLRTPMGEGEVHVGMPGLHNVYNATAAMGAGLASGESFDGCAEALAALVGVKGRLEAVPNNSDLHIFVDYAHTDDALRTILYYLNGIRREAKIENRIITVFGCGGDRDKGKRPLMMKAAQEASDLVVVTSDNPRTENPDQIIKEALVGASAGSLGRTVFEESDRRAAIQKAIGMARAGDVIVIAGKGHEDYQIIGGTRFPFSDVEIVKEILK